MYLLHHGYTSIIIILNSKLYELKNYCLELVITMLHYYKNNFSETTYLPYKKYLVIFDII